MGIALYNLVSEVRGREGGFIPFILQLTETLELKHPELFKTKNPELFKTKAVWLAQKISLLFIFHAAMSLLDYQI